MLHAVEVDPNSMDRLDPRYSILLFEEFGSRPRAGDILLVNNTGPEGDDEIGRSTGHVVRTHDAYELAWVEVDWEGMVWS